MKKHKITSLKSLRKRKAALALEIEQQRTDIVHEAESLVWPFRVFRKFRNTAEHVADNKFFAIGVQFAQSILNAAWKRKKENEVHEEHGIADFLKQVADDFLSNYGKKEKTGETE